MATTPLRNLTRESTASPHYSAGRKYALFGAEEKVVIDLGSKIWKFGFSGESSPRGILDTATFGDSNGLWDMNCALNWSQTKADAVEAAVQRALRGIIHRQLMLDAKQRKVVVLENPFWPIAIKEMIARILFGNLQCTTLTFLPTPSSALMACGLVTGLVVDCGFLETSVTPIYCARPMYHLSHTTIRAGRLMRSRLRTLLLQHGRFADAAPQISGVPSAPTNIPPSLLTDTILDDLIGRACFVGEPLPEGVENTATPNNFDPTHSEDLPDGIIRVYKASNTATSIVTQVSSENAMAKTPKGTIHIPGWIRERAAEVLFEVGNEDLPSLVDTILNTLVKLPVDLRKTMAANILVSGGMAMLPGFGRRLTMELTMALNHAANNATKETFASAKKAKLVRRKSHTRFSSLSALVNTLAVVNNPSVVLDSSATGKSPNFAYNLLPWIGASIAISLKANLGEITREQWTTSGVSGDFANGETRTEKQTLRMPDWTNRHFIIQAAIAPV